MALVEGRDTAVIRAAERKGAIIERKPDLFRDHAFWRFREKRTVSFEARL